MKKLFFGFILIQFFFLIGGQNQAFAGSDQMGHFPDSAALQTSVPESTSPDLSKGICLIKALPANSEKENHLFESLFYETEEEDERHAAFHNALDSILYLALYHSQLLPHEYTRSDNPGEYSSNKPFNHSSSPTYLIFQVFRI